MQFLPHREYTLHRMTNSDRDWGTLLLSDSIRGHVHMTSTLRGREGVDKKEGRLHGFGTDKGEGGGPMLSRHHLYIGP